MVFTNLTTCLKKKKTLSSILSKRLDNVNERIINAKVIIINNHDIPLHVEKHYYLLSLHLKRPLCIRYWCGTNLLSLLLIFTNA